MKNIELKIKINDLRGIENTLKMLGAKYRGILNQTDTYFNSENGRLKIRETNGKSFELIFYRRADKKINSISDYKVLPLTKSQLKLLKKILANSMGVRIIVVKKRMLWLYKNTRIHLDRVNKLGKFLELETVLDKISKIEGEKEYLAIYQFLKLDQYKGIDRSYSDLLSER